MSGTFMTTASCKDKTAVTEADVVSHKYCCNNVDLTYRYLTCYHFDILQEQFHTWSQQLAILPYITAMCSTM